MFPFKTSVLLGAAAGGALFAAAAIPGHARDHRVAAPPASTEAPREAIDLAQSLSDSFAWAADQVRPAVVTLMSSRHIAANMSEFNEMPGELGDMLRRFGMQGMPQHGQQQPELEQRGEGSGVIVRADGVILTNNHVVADADELTVRLPDGHEYPGKVLGTDPMSDLAVVKIEGADFPVAAFADSDAVRVGSWVIAVGNPLGLEDTITAGIISAKGRSDVHITEFEDFLQTDAAINPGNSGGPLVDLHGNIVGINTAIASRTGGFQGVGFAIPANMAHSVMEQLLENGVVHRGLLGVLIQPLDNALARSFDFEGKGVLVSEVVEHGAADKAGMRPGDIVERFNGRDVADVKQLQRYVAECKPGKEVEIEVWRDGESQTLYASLSEREQTMTVMNSNIKQPADELGLGLRSLDASSASAQGLSEDLEGVLVTEVKPGSVAAQSGLIAGDVILEVQGEPVTSPRSFTEQIKKHSLEDGVRLLVHTDAHRHYLVLRRP
jgi:serine protease Do